MNRNVIVAGIALLLHAAVAPAMDEASRGSAGGIAHLSGGIGVAEQKSIEAREKDYNLKLVFTLVEGNYLADVGVTVKDSTGKPVLEDMADGPFFLAKLAPGNYTIAATYDGKTVTRKVQVGASGTRIEYMRWPSNPASDFAVSRWSEK